MVNFLFRTEWHNWCYLHLIDLRVQFSFWKVWFVFVLDRCMTKNFYVDFMFSCPSNFSFLPFLMYFVYVMSFLTTTSIYWWFVFFYNSIFPFLPVREVFLFSKFPGLQYMKIFHTHGSLYRSFIYFVLNGNDIHLSLFR